MSAEFHITSDRGALGEAPHVREVISDTFTDLGHELTNGFAHKFIRFKVRQIIGCVGLPRSRREDREAT